MWEGVVQEEEPISSAQLHSGGEGRGRGSKDPCHHHSKGRPETWEKVLTVLILTPHPQSVQADAGTPRWRQPTWLSRTESRASLDPRGAGGRSSERGAPDREVGVALACFIPSGSQPAPRCGLWTEPPVPGALPPPRPLSLTLGWSCFASGAAQQATLSPETLTATGIAENFPGVTF